MKLKLLILLLITTFGSAQVVINEFDAENPGPNDYQIVELKTPLPNTSLNGYVLVFYNATSAGTGTTSYLAIDLDGYTTDINGNFLAGSVAVSPFPSLLIGNSNLQIGPDVIALYSGNATDFPNGIIATSTNLIDAVAYSTSSTLNPTALMSILGISACYVDTQPLNSISKSIQRKADGTYEVKTPTPKANNDGSGIPINYLTTSSNAASYTEGQNVVITFTTSLPVTTNTTFFINLNNNNFNSLDYSYDTNNSVTILNGATTVTKTITLTDDVLDEGDEEFLLFISGLPVDVEVNNNSIIKRVTDNDFVIAGFGTPLNPTFGNVNPSVNLSTYYSSLEGLSGLALKQAVQNLVANSNVRLHSYADMWDIIRTADTNPANSSQIWDMYLEIPMSKIDQQQSSSIVGKWNREHIFPQSRGGFDVALGDIADGISVWNSTSAASVIDGVSDAHHIRAENGSENSSRNNKNYGSIGSTTVYAGPATGTQGSWKGDVARSLFYMAVRFNGLNLVSGDPSEFTGGNPSGNIGDLAALLAWNTFDPKDDFEMNRNNYVQTWQNNRNPFIDYPLLAYYIFGAQFGQVWNAALATDSFNVNEISIHPSPTTNYIIVSGITEKTTADIFDVTGKKVLRTIAENNFPININLESGVYFVKVFTNENQIVKKIIVK